MWARCLIFTHLFILINIVTITSSTQAVLDYKWLKSGVHINSVGAVNRIHQLSDVNPITICFKARRMRKMSKISSERAE